jgi:hypothetical protein
MKKMKLDLIRIKKKIYMSNPSMIIEKNLNMNKKLMTMLGNHLIIYYISYIQINYFLI